MKRLSGEEASVCVCLSVCVRMCAWLFHFKVNGFQCGFAASVGQDCDIKVLFTCLKEHKGRQFM